MTPKAVTEEVLEDHAFAVLESLGWTCLHGARIAPDGAEPERATYHDVLLGQRLTSAIDRLNPKVPAAAREDALRRVEHLDVPGLVASNRHFHRLLVDGVEVDVQVADGTTRGERIHLVDFDDPHANDLLAVRQYTVVEGNQNRRADVVLFVNGLPLALLELKNPVDENATIESAFHQLQTYKKQLASLLQYNELLVISDGVQARLGSLTSIYERFLPWRTEDGRVVAPKGKLELDTLIRGVFEPRRMLELVRGFVAFEDDGAKVEKKLAGYHQFHAVRFAVAETVRAAAVQAKAAATKAKPAEGVSDGIVGYGKRAELLADSSGKPGDRRIGVVWHTQGSGKSLTMAFYAGRVIAHPAMENPTLVVLTDRNDLDDQLFTTFARCKDLLRQTPVQADSRDHLRELLQVASGGVVFTTIQKFMPEGPGERFPVLSDRRNIVVVADEAHRSQYGFRATYQKGVINVGFAQHLRDALPNASFIGFTGTPIELEDKNTRAVFGDYISVYDIQRAVEDGATVPIYYEGRLARISLPDEAKAALDAEFDEVTEGEETTRKDQLKSRWAQLEAVVGDDSRLELVAKDIVEHFEKRRDAMDGKAMVVCMSRRICAALYEAIRALRPEWHGEGDDQGEMKVVITGSASDVAELQPHIRNKARLTELAKRFRDPDDAFKLVIVRDMWLTGFDAPCLHTLYVDKPMQGHGLMQAIARVNRVFRDKPGGLVVDYIGLADSLQKAVQTYTQSGGRGETTVDTDEAVSVLLEKLEVCRDLFHGFDVQAFVKGTPIERVQLLPQAVEHVLEQDDGADRLMQVVLELSKANALCSARDEAIEVRDEVAFYQAVRVALSKVRGGSSKSQAELDHAVRQIVSKAIAAEGMVDIFAAVGLKSPDLGILSEEFLAEVSHLPQKNLAAELLRKLLADELKIRRKTNLVQSEAFSAKLERTVARYHNRAVQTVEVIEELIEIAKEMQAAKARGDNLKLTDDELAFYDALGTNESAVQVMGDAALTMIARELTDIIRKNVTIDWTQKEQVRAKLKVLVKRKLKQHGYPPDLQEQAVATVLKQAEMLAAEWAA